MKIEKKTEMVCLFLFILFLHRTEAAVEPNKFTCTTWSPVDPADYSTGKPPIPLTHIFCGQIKPNSNPAKAEGFHALPDGTHPNSARVKNNAKVTSKSRNMLVCCENKCDVEVLNKKAIDPKQEWVTKEISGATSTLPQCFFRESIPATVQKIQNVYNNCNINGRREQEVCVINVYENDGKDGYYLQFFLDGNRNVVSAFPVMYKIAATPTICLNYKNANDCKVPAG